MDENRKNEHGADVNQTPAPETTKVHPTLSWGKICRRAALVLCSLLLLVLASVIAALGLLQTGNGQAFLEKKLNELVAASGVSIHGLRGSIPLDFSLALSFADSRGTWLEIKNASLGLDFSDFPALLHVDLGVEEGLLARLPDSSPAHAQQTTPLDVRDLLKTISGATSGFPSWIPGIEIRSLAIDHLRVQRSLYDQAYARESESLQAQKEAAIRPPDQTANEHSETGTQVAQETDCPRTNDADVLLLALHGRAKIAPHAEKKWADPMLFGDISLLLLPEDTGSRQASPGPDKASSTTAEKDSGQVPYTNFPVRTVLAGTGLDVASCAITLSGSLSEPRLAAETRAGTVQTGNLALHNPSLRLVLPSSTLPNLLAGEKGQIGILANTLVQNTPLALNVQFYAQLIDERLLLSLVPCASSPGIALDGKIGTELGSDFFLPARQNHVLEDSCKTSGSAAEAASVSRLPNLANLLPALDGEVRLVLENAPLLAEFLPLSMHGLVQTKVDLAFQNGRQRADLVVQGKNISLASAEKMASPIVSLSSASATASIDGLDLNNAELAASIDTKDVRTSTIKPVHFTLEAKGNASEVALSALSSGGVQTELVSKLSLKASEIRLTRFNLGIPQHDCGLRLLGETVLALGEKSYLKNCSLALQPSGKLDLAGHLSSDSLGAKLLLTHLDTSAWARVVPGLPAGKIDAVLDVAGSPQMPTGKLKVRVDSLTLPVKGLPPLSADVEGSLDNKGAARAVVNLAQASRDALELDTFVCEANVPLLDKNGRFAFATTAPLRIKTDISGSVAKLWLLALQPNRRLTGNFRLQADIGGTLASPSGKANISLKDALFKDVEYGILVREINADINASLAGSLAATKIDFAIDAKDGRRKKGSFSLNGSTNLQTVTARASLDQFAPLRRRDIRAVLSANCSVSGPLTAPQITGRLNVDRGRIQLDALQLPSSITTLPLVEGPKEAILAARKQAVTREQKKRSNILGNLDITLGVNKFFVTGYGFDSEWKAGMRMQCPLARPGITGQVEAVRGSLDLLNKRFTLNEGTVKFAGGLDPLINVQMTTVVNAIETSVVVSGTAAKLNLHLTSNPSMPRNDILAYMLFGKPANELSQFELLRLGATAASFAAFGTTGGSGIANLARQITGLDVLNFSQNDGSAQLELGSYVMDKVYVGVKQDTSENADTTAVIQIELGPRTSATMEAGSGNTSAGVKWKLDY